MKTILAQSKIYIGDYYFYKRVNFAAAKVFYNEAITAFPDSPSREPCQEAPRRDDREGEQGEHQAQDRPQEAVLAVLTRRGRHAMTRVWSLLLVSAFLAQGCGHYRLGRRPRAVLCHALRRAGEEQDEARADPGDRERDGARGVRARRARPGRGQPVGRGRDARGHPCQLPPRKLRQPRGRQRARPQVHPAPDGELQPEGQPVGPDALRRADRSRCSARPSPTTASALCRLAPATTSSSPSTTPSLSWPRCFRTR